MKQSLNLSDPDPGDLRGPGGLNSIDHILGKGYSAKLGHTMIDCPDGCDPNEKIVKDILPDHIEKR